MHTQASALGTGVPEQASMHAHTHDKGTHTHTHTHACKGRRTYTDTHTNIGIAPSQFKQQPSFQTMERRVFNAKTLYLVVTSSLSLSLHTHTQPAAHMLETRLAFCGESWSVRGNAPAKGGAIMKAGSA